MKTRRNILKKCKEHTLSQACILNSQHVLLKYFQRTDYFSRIWPHILDLSEMTIVWSKLLPPTNPLTTKI